MFTDAYAMCVRSKKALALADALNRFPPGFSYEKYSVHSWSLSSRPRRSLSCRWFAAHAND